MLRLYLLLVLCVGCNCFFEARRGYVTQGGVFNFVVAWYNPLPSMAINISYQYMADADADAHGRVTTVQVPGNATRYTVRVTRCGLYHVFVTATVTPQFGSGSFQLHEEEVRYPCPNIQRQLEAVATVAATTRDAITTTPPAHHADDHTERWNGWDGSGYEETDKDTIPYEHFLPGGGGGRNDPTTRPRPVPSTRAPVGTDHPPTSPAPKPSAPSPNVSSLLVARLESQLKELRSKQKSFELHIGDLRKTVADLKRCNPEKLGYKYGAGRFFKLDSRRRGTLARLDFRKSRGDTVLRLAFAATFRVTGAQETALRIFFQIDGVDCFSPSKVEYGLYQKDRQSAVGRPVVVRGVCRSSNRGPILGGHHVITVNIGTVPGYPDRGSDVEIGWASAKFVEVQEVCVNHSDYMAEF